MRSRSRPPLLLSRPRACADWTLPRPAAYRTQLSSDWWPVRAIFAELHQQFVDANPGCVAAGYGRKARGVGGLQPGCLAC